jgi:1-acyl-sn-glycerol-3-phosphate acyltransferase
MILSSLIKTSFVAKKEVSSWPLLGLLAKLQKTLFIDRKISSIKRQENLIEKHLKEKRNLVIFPEGTSTDGNKVQFFKSSLFNIFENKINTKINIQNVTMA